MGRGRSYDRLAGGREAGDPPPSTVPTLVLSAVSAALRRWAASTPGLDVACRAWPWLFLAAAVPTALVLDGVLRSVDGPMFADAGRRLWSAGGLDAFNDPAIQAGALQLTWYAALASIEAALRVPNNLVMSLAVQVASGFTLAGLAALPFHLRARAAPRGLLLAVCGVSVLFGIGTTTHAIGHLAQIAVPALWVLAGARAQRGQAWSAGILIAVSSGFETWGLLGAPILLLLAGRRLRLRALAGVAVACSLLWGPFLAFGDFAMHEYEWMVRPESPVALLLGEMAPFGWELRLLQGLVALAAGVLVVRRLRGSPHVIWAVAVAVVAGRVMVDPYSSPYYLIAVQVLAVTAAGTYVAERDPRGIPIVALLYLSLFTGIVATWPLALAALAAAGHVAMTRSAVPSRSRLGVPMPNV